MVCMFFRITEHLTILIENRKEILQDAQLVVILNEVGKKPQQL